ncbi:hypothetical protein D3C78_1952870 [compost metagenome]
MRAASWLRCFSLRSRPNTGLKLWEGNAGLINSCGNFSRAWASTGGSPHHQVAMDGRISSSPNRN